MPRTKAPVTRRLDADECSNGTEQGSTIKGALSGAEENIVVRVRHPGGIERFTVDPTQTTVQAFLLLVELKLGRNARENMQIPSNTPDVLKGASLLEIGVKHGDMFTVASGAGTSKRERPARARVATEFAKEEQPQEAQPTAQRKRPRPSKTSAEKARGERATPKISDVEFEDYDGMRSLGQVARAYQMCSLEGPCGGENRGETVFDVFAAAARCQAVLRPTSSRGKCWVSKIEVVQRPSREVTGKAGRVVVDYRGQHPKPRQDSCPLLTFEMMVELVAAIIGSGTSSRRATHLVTMQELASRYPPLLWSLYFYATETEPIPSKVPTQTALDRVKRSAEDLLDLREQEAQRLWSQAESPA